MSDEFYHSAISRFLLLLLLLVSAPGYADPGAAHLPNYRATYDVWNGILKLGILERRLQTTASGEYAFESRMETRGLAALVSKYSIVETSRGEFNAGRVRPLHYEYARVGKKEKAFKLEFDRRAGMVRRAAPEPDWSTPISANVLDKLAYQAQLMLDLVTEPSAIHYDIADNGKLKKYDIQIIGLESVETGSGTFEALRLEREKSTSKRKTTMWCAQALGWLPIKVANEEKNGTVTTALLRSYEL